MPTAASANLFAAFITVLFVSNFAADDFLSASRVSDAEVEADLMRELSKAGASLGDIDSLEASLRPMYVALPKDDDGFLPHTVARYALHRLLVHKHGWYVRGLEPDGEARNASSPDQLVKSWVPSHLQEVLESRVGRGGLTLHELAVIAATLEDVARREAVARAEAVYNIFGLDTGDSITSETVDEVYDMYALIYLRGGKIELIDADDALWRLGNFRQNFHSWSSLRLWMDSLLRNITSEPSRLEFSTVKRLAEEFGARYAFYDSRACSELKTALVSIEEERPGRVRLADFYATGMASNSTFQFTERIDWLRALGALDESNPLQPSVIISNYVISRPQCLEASSIYAVCCRNECEDLLTHLEEQIKDSTALPGKVIELVQALPSSTVTSTPRELPDILVHRLRQIAHINRGRVPLHGRLFAQWMHHAYPRECPFPHEAGSTNPSTPDEWLRETGQDSTQATEEEMQCHVMGPCSHASSSNQTDLPWSEAEELLAVTQKHHVDLFSPHARRAVDGRHFVLLRSLSQFGLLFGLSTVAWRSFVATARAARVPGYDGTLHKNDSRWYLTRWLMARAISSENPIASGACDQL
eukprot:TRINITY_DN16057_c0_g1_i1.p1 TRINITY_DN16057_c0_g1~~TRINITY_DN16057_c0_g1_i1.p1  ORF type:complete len:588 (+),score=83.28 TRINITY_DN16057_c0_g1_i1:80-1843(+)